MSVYFLGQLGDLYGASVLVRKTLPRSARLRHCPLPPHRDRRAPETVQGKLSGGNFRAAGAVRPPAYRGRCGVETTSGPLFPSCLWRQHVLFSLAALGWQLPLWLLPPLSGPGVPRAVRPPNLSGSPARGSEGRRFPTAGSMGRESR